MPPRHGDHATLQSASASWLAEPGASGPLVMLPGLTLIDGLDERGRGHGLLVARHILVAPGHGSGIVAGGKQERDAALLQRLATGYTLSFTQVKHGRTFPPWRTWKDCLKMMVRQARNAYCLTRRSA